MDTRVARLENGLQVVTAPMPGMYSAAVSVFVDAGSRLEAPQDAGSAHLIEHMLFKGTRRRPTAEEISETIERVGGAMNAGTDKEQTVYYAKVARDRVGVAVDLLADMLLESLFEPAEVDKERRVVIEELDMSIDSPQDWVHSVIDELIWPGTSLGRDVAGTKESVAALTRDGLLAFRRAGYAPTSTVVSVAGAVEHEAALELVEGWFGNWRHDGGAAPALDHGEQQYPARGPKVYFEQRQTEQANLCLAVRGVARDDPDRFAFDLLTQILGGAMSSRLFLEVRERLGLAYDVHSYTNKFAETGSLITYAAVDGANVRAVVAEVLRQLDRLRREIVPASELEKVKDHSKGRLFLGLEDTGSVAGWCGTQQQLYGRIWQPDEVAAAIDAVEAEDVQRLAQACFRDEYLRLAVLGPTHTPELEEILHLAPLPGAI